jgi:hypothetical protein
LAFTGGDGDTDSAHCYPCHPTATPTFTPTPTATPTLIPTPVLQACQVDQVIINGQEAAPGSITEVEAGQTLNLRLRLVDAQDQPLIGAKVEATVIPLAVSAQAAITPLDILDDMAGFYDAVYPLTEDPGDYTFKFEASDLNGPDFLPCSAERTVRIMAPPTPTPTDTPTPTPTVTATPTPPPGVSIDPPSQTIDLCGTAPDIASTIAISNVTNLTGVQLQVSYDPAFIQVIDAFGTPRPPYQQVEVSPDPNFDPWLTNTVNTRQGTIDFAANAHTPVTGSSNVILIDWRLQGRTGVTPINVTAVLTDAAGTRTVTGSATFTIIINSVCTQGAVNLQGRTDHSGVQVSSAAGEQAQSYPTGLFAVKDADSLTFAFPGYLSVQSDLPGSAASAAITLLAGDINGDQTIDILDLAFMAGHYLSTDPAADLNADGQVDILDMALAAGNYGESSQ